MPCTQKAPHKLLETGVSGRSQETCSCFSQIGSTNRHRHRSPISNQSPLAAVLQENRSPSFDKGGTRENDGPNGGLDSILDIRLLQSVLQRPKRLKPPRGPRQRTSIWKSEIGGLLDLLVRERCRLQIARVERDDFGCSVYESIWVSDYGEQYSLNRSLSLNAPAAGFD